jgi:hypothetical protein
MNGRPFGPGNKFGRGRPRGSKNKCSGKAQQLLDEYAEPLIRKALALGIQGDKQILRLLAPYLLRKPEDRPVQTGPLAVGTAEELSKTSENILKRVTSGKLSLADAQSMSILIENRRRSLETEEFEMRMRALEKILKRESSE